MTTFLRRVAASTTVGPNTTFYLIAAGLILATSAGWLPLQTSLTILTTAFVIVLYVAWHRESAITRRELGTIHELVNSGHDELVAALKASDARVDQLLVALRDAGVAAPLTPTVEELAHEQD